MIESLTTSDPEAAYLVDAWEEMKDVLYGRPNNLVWDLMFHRTAPIISKLKTSPDTSPDPKN